jgi:hypothetical protein
MKKEWNFGEEQDVTIENAIAYVRNNVRSVVKKATADVWEMYIIADRIPLGQQIFNVVDIDEGSAGITAFETLEEAEKAFEKRLHEDARIGEEEA